MRPRFICLVTGCGNISESSRCPEHDGRTKRRHPGRQRRPRYDADWARRSREARQAQPWCTICGDEDDLTLDHIIPGSTDGGVMVLCRTCNSRKSGQDRRFRNQIDRL